MHSFRKFLVESRTYISDAQDAINNIQAESDLVATALASAGKLLYRGMDKDSPYGIGENRMDRTPLDSYKNFSALVDNKLNEKFGFRGRTQAVFCTSKPHIAATYGNKYIVVPYDSVLENKKFVWSPVIEDLYISIQKGRNALASEQMRELFKKHTGEDNLKSGSDLFDSLVMYDLSHPDSKILEELVDWIVSTYQNDDFVAAVKSGHEIMFQGKYTYLSTDYLFDEYDLPNYKLLDVMNGVGFINDYFKDEDEFGDDEDDDAY